MSGYYLTEQTHADLMRLLAMAPGQSPYGVAGGASRHVSFVEITSGSDNPYTGTCKHVDNEGSEVSFEADAVLVYEFKSRPLTIGEVYLCVQTGYQDGESLGDPSYPVFITSNPCVYYSFCESVSCSGSSLVVSTKWYKNGQVFESDPGACPE